MRAVGKNNAYTLNFTGSKSYWTSEGWHFTGLTRITFDGNGATLKAPGFISGKANPYFFMQYPFFTTTSLETQLHCQTEQTANAGHLFATAAAGATTVTLSTASNASQYVAGQIAFLYGYDTYKTGGVSFPPRALRFEWLTVQSSNVGAGTVTFTTPLVNSYDSTWQDTENLASGVPYGAPRAIPWEARGAPISVACRNFTLIAKTPTSGFADNEGALRFPGVTVDIDNVSGVDTHFVPQVSKLTTLDDCAFKFAEYDKLVELVASNGITIDELIAGTGIKAATFQDSAFNSVGYSGGDATFDNCDLGTDPAIYSYFPGSVVVTDNTMTSMPVASPSFSPDNAFANDATTYAVADSGGVTVSLTFAAGLNMWKQLQPGDTLWLKRRSSAGMVLATITGHQMDGAGGDRFLISCSDLVLVNSVILRVAQQHRYLFTGNTAGALCAGYSYIDWARSSGLCEMRVSTDLFDTSTRLWKNFRRAVTLNSITINVSTPYTGTDTTPVLTLQSRAVDLATWNGSTLVSRDIAIDLKTAGVRTIGPSAGTPLGTDSLAGWNSYLSGPEVMIWASPTVSGDLGAGKIVGDSANSPNQAVMPQVAITWTFTPVVS